MLEYEFETVDCNHAAGYSLMGGVRLETAAYRESIRRRAEDGWRYTGWIPRSQKAGGFIETIDLIFERERGNA